MTQREGIIAAYNKGYKVLENGDVLSHKGKILSLGKNNKNGYLNFCLRQDKQKVSIGVHRLQAFQKYGYDIFKDGIQVRHKNGIAKDNSFDNILIGSASDNQMDRSIECRTRTAMIATSFVRKHDKELIKKYYKENGFTKTMKHFNISSKGTMSYIINH